MPRDPILYRDPELLTAILDAIYEDPEPLPYLDLVDALAAGTYARRTIEAAIYDLVMFGAIARTGQPATTRRADTRTLRPTPLGRAWVLDEPLPPLPHERNTP